MPCRKGSGNEPTTAGVRARPLPTSAHTRSPPWTFVSSSAATPLTKRAPRGSPRTSAATVAPSLTSHLAHDARAEVAGDRERDRGLVAGLAHAAAGQQHRDAEEAASCGVKGGATLQGGTFAS